MFKVYGIKNCDSVKKALKFFKEHNLAYTLQDFKEEKVSEEKISFWLTQVDMKSLFNAKSTTYRTLKLKELNLNEEGQKEWLAKNNLLIKRPVVEFNKKVVVGYNEDIYKGVFL
ncbi:MAG: Spx/MgsR family RNA polymerase-binding regulatory protein [Epsilonproteobacteria bacterium]|nr:Spx/MgsR family RNA polymerase-binding regulatory protein [Campylobacterota bacterium]OIO14269.1 MAG: arsenate reductase family protein [Helicobacteraceae bacterium CG1_02_36_14]PIP11180.1 MAG: arsenate reductase family protein [Sulfurimonas sp. CG23_combo_of_CG06-09_8_20_14_all_36_33]PIS25972.1 MAG: arsenate reductase family protein [Sulfurimonas sp. CG08_land_8_20_14_0_20_36_33]PIU35613.1 MAG: arsenate reductase family protein [Sulfurimonas sp. CG07_land_8_20_14_0_80_36_56]PIV04481.1 MAG: